MTPSKNIDIIIDLFIKSIEADIELHNALHPDNKLTFSDIIDSLINRRKKLINTTGFTEEEIHEINR